MWALSIGEAVCRNQRRLTGCILISITEAFFSHPFLDQVPVKKCEYSLSTLLLKA